MKFTLLLAALAVAAQATDPILDIIIDSLGERPHIPDIQKAVQTFRCAAPCVQYAATQVGVPSAVCGVPKLNLEPKSICDNLDQIQAKSEPCVKKCGVSHIFIELLAKVARHECRQYCKAPANHKHGKKELVA